MTPTVGRSSRAASKAARWLGYVPFEKIIDARNAEPIIRIARRPTLAGDQRGSLIELPDAEDLEPQVMVGGFDERQNIASCSSARRPRWARCLSPLAESLDADLYLPSGEISDTLLAMMAKTGAEDGREMVVLVMADCDPAGYQMAVSIGHKLRAFKEGFYPSLRFQVHAPALTVEQVRRFDLPSTPLKETEAAGVRLAREVRRRADRDRRARHPETRATPGDRRGSLRSVFRCHPPPAHERG